MPTNQGGFVRRRRIFDNIILVQEAMHSGLVRKEKGMVIKIDLANAYDRVRHSYLFEVLSCYGFDEGFRNWIKACIGEPWISPLVNGCTADFFKASRGLRQGFPLSPLIYVLQASVLSRLLDRRRQDQDLLGIRMTREFQNINHTQFANDALLIEGASS